MNNGIFDWHDYNSGDGWNRSAETWRQIDKLQMREIAKLKQQNKEMREILLGLGDEPHKLKRLFAWCAENAKGEK